MSGPVSTTDAISTVPPATHPQPAAAHDVEVTESREATVGNFRVRRALPRRQRRTVGAWCFADHMGPAQVTENSGLDVGPHPHLGLQTVTWLVAGEALHRDSLGSEQVIRPGQLNLMTAGGGVAHAEEATGRYRGELQGVQLWVAQPEETRHGEPAFEHHAELPVVDVDCATATVLVGDFGGHTSPARQDTPLVGVDVVVPPGRAALPLRRDFEYAVIVLEGAITIGGATLVPGRLGYLALDHDELGCDAESASRFLLLGGEPFAERILMWWNFVARTREEMNDAYREWESDGTRFGSVSSSLARIPAPRPVWLV